MILERQAKINFDQLKFDPREADLPVDTMFGMLKEFIEMQQLYRAAVKEMSTKLEILDDEFQIKYAHNPIHHMESRLKQPQSIKEKLERKRFELSVESAMENLTDIAGIRVICHYIDDIYQIAEMLLNQPDLSLIKKADYIKTPKANGYRSLHLVISVPVRLSDQTKHVPVEIQIRTIAMDFWASLEHQLKYKSDSHVKEDLQKELTECALSIAAVDEKMQKIYQRLANESD